MQEAGGHEGFPRILGDGKHDHEVPWSRTVICKAHSLEKGHNTSVTCEIFFNSRQCEDKTSVNLFLLFVTGPLSENKSQLTVVTRQVLALHTHPYSVPPLPLP